MQMDPVVREDNLNIDFHLIKKQSWEICSMRLISISFCCRVGLCLFTAATDTSPYRHNPHWLYDAVVVVRTNIASSLSFFTRSYPQPAMFAPRGYNNNGISIFAIIVWFGSTGWCQPHLHYHRFIESFATKFYEGKERRCEPMCGTPFLTLTPDICHVDFVERCTTATMNVNFWSNNCLWKDGSVQKQNPLAMRDKFYLLPDFYENQWKGMFPAKHCWQILTHPALLSCIHSGYEDIPV